MVADFLVPNSPSVTASRAPSRCGSVTRGSDSPPGCHSLPLARLRLRLAYPLHRGGFHTREFSAHYQLDFESIFNRRRRRLTSRGTEKLYLRKNLPAIARYTLKPRCKPKLFQRSFTKNLAAAARYTLHHTNIQNRLFRGFAKTSPPRRCDEKTRKKNIYKLMYHCRSVL